MDKGTETSRILETNRQEPMRAQWQSFARALFNPAIFISLVAALGLVYFSAYGPDQIRNTPLLLAMVSVLASVTSGLAGSFLEKEWSKLTEGKVLVTRGRSAIRGLRLLLLHLNQVESRASVHLERACEHKVEPSLIGSYEELILHFSSLQEEAINSIEDWEDIIPEANVKGQIEILRGLRDDAARHRNRAKELETMLAESHDKSAGERALLQKQLDVTKSELQEANKKLRARELHYDTGLLGAVVAAAATGTSSFGIPPKPSLTLVSAHGRCPNCKDSLAADVGKPYFCLKCGRMVTAEKPD